MRALQVIKGDVSPNGLSRLWHTGVGLEVDLLIFDSAPEPFDKNIVAPGSFAIHGNLDVLALEHIGEVYAGELRALIGVEDFWLAVFGESFFQCLNRGRIGKGAK